MKATFAPQRARAYLTLLLATLALAGCVTPATSPAPKPRLVVFIAIDGLPQRQVVDYRDQLAPDGFRRFLDRGAWFADAHFGHSNTQTAPGHATMLTGAYPHRTGSSRTSGAISNRGARVQHRRYGAYVYRTQDAETRRNRSEESSRRNRRRRASPRRSALESDRISGKDRGAIRPAGKTGVAYMYWRKPVGSHRARSTWPHIRVGRWISTHANPRTPIRSRMATAARRRGVREIARRRAEVVREGRKLPKKLGEAMEAPGPMYYGTAAQPVRRRADAFARAAIAGEALGRDEFPDILAISLSSHDYVNHAYSAESRISHDHMLQVDRLLQTFFRDLDATIGRDNYAAVFTADTDSCLPRTTADRSARCGKTKRIRVLARSTPGSRRSSVMASGRWGYRRSLSVLIGR